MTDKTQALRDLLAKVEAGVVPPTKLIVQAFGCRRLPNGWDVAALIKWIMGDTIEAMGAAKALHEAVLPGWWAAVRFSTRPKATTGYIDCVYEGQDECPASAWLICTIRALIAQAER